MFELKIQTGYDPMPTCRVKWRGLMAIEIQTTIKPQAISTKYYLVIPSLIILFMRSRLI